MFSNLIALLLMITSVYFVDHSRTKPDVFCTMFNCTINNYGTCHVSSLVDLYFNCYPRYCVSGGLSIGDNACYLSQTLDYPCYNDDHVVTCHTAYYTYVGEGNFMLYFGLLHLTMRYIHSSLLGIIILVYFMVRRLSPVLQVKPYYSLLVFIGFSYSSWAYIRTFEYFW